MYYSTYRWTLIGVYVLIGGVISIAVSFSDIGVGILVAVTYGFVGLVFFPIHFAVMGDRLRQFDGVFPHPSWVWPRFQWPRIIDDRPPAAVGKATDEGGSPRPICSTCRTTAAKPTAKYCHECGTPFPLTSSTAPSG